MKILIGRVVKIKTNKTVIVLVKKYIKHFFYKKYLIKLKKYHVHDEFNLSNENDLVEIVNIKPRSKTKFWKILRFLF